ncbi:MAG: cryptochrome/photolyase family protein [Janthinobacterium lividum]
MLAKMAGVKTERHSKGDRLALLWLRQDLRLADNHALHAALAEADHVLPVFVLDQDAGRQWAPGGASLWWLHHSLASLGSAYAKLGTRLILRRGDASVIIPELARETGAESVQCGTPHEPWLRQLDETVAKALQADGRRFATHRVATLYDLDSIRSKTGTRYGIYTPFANTCRAMPDPQEPLPAPEAVAGPASLPDSDRLEDWHLLPTTPDWAGGLRDTWTPGEASAATRLHEFLDTRLDGYGTSRDIPGDPKGTSMLSPHLHWGELSATQVWYAARDAAAKLKGARAGGFERFQGELLWHEFAAYLLRHNPAMPDDPLRPAFARLPWRDDAGGLQAWQRGRTGIPIVDAGMRQLWQLGWMHNRARMITASYLVKHMLVSWQQGEAWFWDALVDADLATNSASWQWVAGTGTDSQPFFRVFNPVTQGRKFDPDGVYVRQYVPELKALPDRWLHEPWAAPDVVLKKAGIVLDRDYPRPIVGLDEGRDRALKAFRNTVQGRSDQAQAEGAQDAAE